MTISQPLGGAVAVLTGAGSGIGRACALAFAQRGAAVAVSDLDAARAKAVADEVEQAGGLSIAVGVDATREDDLVALREAALGAFGRIDVLMNNVGVLAMGAAETLPDEAWTRVIETNIMRVARSNRVFLPLLLAQGTGHVVNTASASGLLAYGFDRLPYVTSKHGVVGMSEALAIYLGPRGVGVTCLCPSGVMTNIVEQITVYGEITSTPRAPAHAVLAAEDVGEMVADAVERGRFLVTTVPEVGPELLERATDIEAYLQARIAEQG